MLRRRIFAPPNRPPPLEWAVTLQYVAKLDQCHRRPACVPPVRPALGPNFPQIDIAPAHFCPAKSISPRLEYMGNLEYLAKFDRRNRRPTCVAVVGSEFPGNRCRAGACPPRQIDPPIEWGVYNIWQNSTGVTGVPPVWPDWGRNFPEIGFAPAHFRPA